MSRLANLLFFSCGLLQVFSLQQVFLQNPLIQHGKYVCLLLGVGSLFLSAPRKYDNVAANVFLSGIAFLSILLSAFHAQYILLAFYCTVSLLLHAYDESVWLKSYSLGVILSFLLFVVIGFAFGNPLDLGTRIRYSFGFASPNFVAMLAMFSALWLAFNLKRPMWRAIMVLGALSLVVLSDSRTGMIVAALGTIVLATIVAGKRLHLGRVFILAFGIAVLTYMIWVSSLSQSSQQFQQIDELLSGRLSLARTNLTDFTLLGGGGYMESYFVSTLGTFGALGIVVLFFVWFSGLSALSAKNRDRFAAGIVIFALLFGLSENVGFLYNVPLSMLFSVYTTRFFAKFEM